MVRLKTVTCAWRCWRSSRVLSRLSACRDAPILAVPRCCWLRRGLRGCRLLAHRRRHRRRLLVFKQAIISSGVPMLSPHLEWRPFWCHCKPGGRYPSRQLDPTAGLPGGDSPFLQYISHRSGIGTARKAVGKRAAKVGLGKSDAVGVGVAERGAFGQKGLRDVAKDPPGVARPRLPDVEARRPSCRPTSCGAIWRKRLANPASGSWGPGV